MSEDIPTLQTTYIVLKSSSIAPSVSGEPESTKTLTDSLNDMQGNGGMLKPFCGFQSGSEAEGV